MMNCSKNVLLAIGEKDPITVDFFKQCENKMKSLKQLVSHAV